MSSAKCPPFCYVLQAVYLLWPLQWRHNEHDGVANHRRLDCLLNFLFRRRAKKTSKPRVTGLCEGNSSVTGEFPAQMASNAENASIWWRHHARMCLVYDSSHRKQSHHGGWWLSGVHFVPRTLLMIALSTLRPRQNGRHFADDLFKCIFLNENVWISIKISPKFLTRGLITNIPALVLIMAWRRTGDTPLSEQMVVSLLTHICVTRPQWAKSKHG